MKRTLRILLVTVLFLAIIYGVIAIFSGMNELNKIVFAIIILAGAIITVGVLVRIYKGKLTTCLLPPAFIGIVLFAIIVIRSEVSPMTYLVGVTIGFIVGFSGTILKWALKPTKS